jgi:hypothetical protein
MVDTVEPVVPYELQTIVPGEDAPRLNQNFGALTAWGKNMLGDVTTLEADHNSLQGDFTALQTDHNALESAFNTHVADTDDAPLGLVASGTHASDVGVGGALAQIVSTLNSFDVVAGRSYRVTFSGGYDLWVWNSNFAIGDTWVQKFQRSIGGGAYGDVTPLSVPTICVHSLIAATARHPVVPCVAYYEPTASAAGVTIRLVMAKVSGHANVFFSAETNGGASPFHINVEDVGLAV